MTAKYLLRFDDLCPTMNWDVWREVEQILYDTGVKPILAIVPDNKDEALRCSEPNSHFWEHVRQWQRAGAAIGLHGFEHRYVTRDSGIIGLNQRSEFAGLPLAEQKMKLTAALEIFRREQITPSVWVAPAHSFDENTVTLLAALRINVISDGFSFFPHVDHLGLMWIPQQLWRFRMLPFGVWTVCFHHNSWTKKDVLRFREDLHRYKHSIVSLAQMMQAYGERHSRFLDSVVARSILSSIRIKRRFLHQSR